MQLFLTHEGQTWNISPYVSASFKDNTLRVFSNENVEQTYQSVTAQLGESYYVQVFGQEKAPILKKANMPEKRGEKILWALSFVEPEKRVSSADEFFKRQPSLAKEYGSNESIIQFVNGGYAFFVAKKRAQPGKGKRSRQVKYKPCLAWCSDTISEKDLQDLIHKYRHYRKIYCPLEFLSVL